MVEGKKQKVFGEGEKLNIEVKIVTVEVAQLLLQEDHREDACEDNHRP